MKKLNRIVNVKFKEDKIYFNQISISLGMGIDKWLNENSSTRYEFENYSKNYPQAERMKFNEISGISIYLEERIITSINVFPFIYDSSPSFKGEIYINDKLLTTPFLANDIEEYLPDIKIEKPIHKYWDRFYAHESVEYLVNDKVKIVVSMDRQTKYVGCISLNEK